MSCFASKQISLTYLVSSFECIIIEKHWTLAFVNAWLEFSCVATMDIILAAVVSTINSKHDGPRLDSMLGPFCVVFACSPYVYLRFLWVLLLSPIVQRHASEVWLIGAVFIFTRIMTWLWETTKCCINEVVDGVPVIIKFQHKHKTCACILQCASCPGEKCRSNSRIGIHPLYPRLLPVLTYALEVPH